MGRSLAQLGRLAGVLTRQRALQRRSLRDILLAQQPGGAGVVQGHAHAAWQLGFGRAVARGVHASAANGGGSALLPPLARAAATGHVSQLGRQLRGLVKAQGHLARSHAADAWRKAEAQVVALVNSVSLSGTGQALLSALLPLTLASALLPGRLRCYAYEMPPGARAPRCAALVVRGAARRPRSHLSVQLSWAATRLGEELALAARALYLVSLFSPVLLGAPLALWLGIGRHYWVEAMRWTLERAGPAFIKWGQWASTRPDLFPKDLCSSLESLQSAAPAHDGRLSRAAVELAFGRPLAELFIEFEEEPLASGSIAQIHRARLSAAAAASSGCKPGIEVAVKVRHPGVSERMAADFLLMQRVAALCARTPQLRALRLEESVRQFGGPLREQLDLSVEAQHLSRFRHNFRRRRDVAFPTPLFPLVHPDVLVESFESGDAVAGLLRYADAGTLEEAVAVAEAGGNASLARTGRPGCALADARRKRLFDAVAQTGMHVYLQMLLRDNFIHADLHPGNILVRTVDPESLGGALSAVLARWAPAAAVPKPQLVLLDTGMIAELSQPDQQGVVTFFKALSVRDGEGLAHAILALSEPHTCSDPDSFVADLKDMFDSLDPETIRKYTSDVLRDMIERLRQHQVTLKSTVSTVVVTTLVLEGWSSRLNPDLHIMDTLRDMLAAGEWRSRISAAVDKVMGGELAVA